MPVLMLLGPLLTALLGGVVEEPEDWSEWMSPPDAIEGCEELLTEAGARFKPAAIPVHEARSGGFLCGAEQIVRYVRAPGGLRYASSPKVTCGMALALTRFEGIVQEEAERYLGRRVRRIEHAGTYNCREMAKYPGWVSEHSYANAIDIRSFVLSNGTEIEVSRAYGRAKPRGREGRFLRAVASRAFDEGVFSVVLTPAHDGAHRSHFHLDLARYRVDGT